MHRVCLLFRDEDHDDKEASGSIKAQRRTDMEAEDGDIE